MVFIDGVKIAFTFCIAEKQIKCFRIVYPLTLVGLELPHLGLWPKFSHDLAEFAAIGANVECPFDVQTSARVILESLFEVPHCLE